jgi:hypothetical protein
LFETSVATRTSPVFRGKWVMSNIFNSPPPPPPANVPALDADGTGAVPTTVRERLERHREDPVCASCHRTMDPVGFALENFDAVGRWRTTDAGLPIDARGELPGGAVVDGPASLREAILARPELFAQTLTEKLMTYALARGLTAGDMPAVRAIVRSAAGSNYRLSALVLGIARSAPFQMKNPESPATATTAMAAVPRTRE